jgi:hypothetical protein
MLNLYADPASFARRFANASALDTGDSSEIERVLESASRRVDEFCNRKFFAETDTRYFDGNACNSMRLPDLIAATSIKLDEDVNGVYELTLAATDYWLRRAGYVDVDSTPKTEIRLNIFRGQSAYFIPTPRLVEIVGRWGYTEAVDRIAPVATIADATTTVMTTAADGDLSIGQTLLIEAEQVYVAAGTGPTWTVKRGVNGTTAAAHASMPIDRFAWVPEVREATLILAGRMWKRRETAYANTIANPVVGSFEVFRRVDPDVAELLGPLVRADWGL